MDLFVLAMRILEVLSQIVSAVCLVVIAFELSPWDRRNSG
jgi:hypothetical protein